MEVISERSEEGRKSETEPKTMLDGGGGVRSLKTVKLFTSCAQQPDGFLFYFHCRALVESGLKAQKERLSIY